MDLRTQFPRSLKEKLGGYVHLGRMIDKCCAVLAGFQGNYIFPCPLDQRLLEFAGITSEQFSGAIRGRGDEGVMGWFVKTATAHSQAKLEQWNEMMLTRGPDTDEKWTYFKSIRDAIDPMRADITSWADLLDLEENRPVPVHGIMTH